jgi:hypothetical protein
MGGRLNNRVICCFCGAPLPIKKAVILIVQPNFSNEEKQQLFCHTNCLVQAVDKSIVLHPDFFEDPETMDLRKEFDDESV